MTDLPVPDEVLDAGPQGCGELIMTMFRRFRTLPAGTVIEVFASDPGAAADIPAWCRLQGHELLHRSEADGRMRFLIRRGAD